MLLTAFAAAAHFDQIAHIFDLATAVIVDVGITRTRGFRLDDEKGASAVDELKFLFTDFMNLFIVYVILIPICSLFF